MQTTLARGHGIVGHRGMWYSWPYTVVPEIKFFVFFETKCFFIQKKHFSFKIVFFHSNCFFVSPAGFEWKNILNQKKHFEREKTFLNEKCFFEPKCFFVSPAESEWWKNILNGKKHFWHVCQQREWNCQFGRIQKDTPLFLSLTLDFRAEYEGKGPMGILDPCIWDRIQNEAFRRAKRTGNF